MTEPTGFLGVDELARRYRAGSLTPLDVVHEALDRIERLDGVLNAFADPMPEQALEEAQVRTKELAGGTDRGPLHGIPVAIKDLIEVRGAPTGYGTRVQTPRMAEVDAECVRRLRQAGAVILGKTHLLEYAYGVAHPEVGQTNNPHDPSRTSGGSSGGSAAAVAAGIVPLAVGTDTGGSIRIPAAYCGLVGMKPSFGLVPTDGVFPLSPSLDHVGPLARSVGDAALALEALSGKPMPLTRISLDDLRIGLLRHHLDAAVVTPGVRDLVRQALAALVAQGARVIDVDIEDLARVNQELVTVLLPEAALVHAELYADNRAGYAEGTRSQIEAGQRANALEYLRAQRSRSQIREAVEAQFSGVDVLFSPSVPFVAPAEDPEFVEGEEGEILSSGLSNMTGHPAISLPCGFSEGLPVGLQLTGRLGGDGGLLSIALAIETVLGRGQRPAI